MINKSGCVSSRLDNRQAYFWNLKKVYLGGVSDAVQFLLNDSNGRVDDIAYALYRLKRTHLGNSKNVSTWTDDDVMVWDTISPSWTDSTVKSANRMDYWPRSFYNKIILQIKHRRIAVTIKLTHCRPPIRWSPSMVLPLISCASTSSSYTWTIRSR